MTETHIYDWLDTPPKDEGERLAKEWLDRFTSPAMKKIRNGWHEWLDARDLTCEWKGKRYRCTGASRLGDVWLKYPESKSFYDQRVPVDELSNWERTDP